MEKRNRPLPVRLISDHLRSLAIIMANSCNGCTLSLPRTSSPTSLPGPSSEAPGTRRMSSSLASFNVSSPRSCFPDQGTLHFLPRLFLSAVRAKYVGRHAQEAYRHWVVCLGNRYCLRLLWRRPIRPELPMALRDYRRSVFVWPDSHYERTRTARP